MKPIYFMTCKANQLHPFLLSLCSGMLECGSADGIEGGGRIEEESWGQCIIKTGLDRTTCVMQPDPYYKLYVPVQRTLRGVRRRSEDSGPHGMQRQDREGRRRKLFITRDERGQSRRLSNFSCVSKLKITCCPVLSMPSKS